MSWTTYEYELLGVFIFYFCFLLIFLKILFIWCCVAYFFLLFRLIFIYLLRLLIFFFKIEDSYMIHIYIFIYLIEDSYMIWSTWLLGDPWLLKISLIHLIIKFFFFLLMPPLPLGKNNSSSFNGCNVLTVVVWCPYLDLTVLLLDDDIFMVGG